MLCVVSVYPADARSVCDSDYCFKFLDLIYIFDQVKLYTSNLQIVAMWQEIANG